MEEFELGGGPGWSEEFGGYSGWEESWGGGEFVEVCFVVDFVGLADLDCAVVEPYC